MSPSTWAVRGFHGRRPSRRIALLTTASLVMLAVALQSDAGGTIGSVEAESPERLSVATVAPDLPAVVSVFRQPQTASDRLPAEGVLPADLQPGENPLLARRIGGGTGPATYAWPMADGVCTLARWGGGCAPTAVLSERGVLLGTSFTSEQKTVYVDALAVDGVTEVVFTLSDGREITAPIANNAFQIALPTDPVRASWVKPDGSSRTQTNLVPRPES